MLAERPDLVNSFVIKAIDVWCREFPTQVGWGYT
jgi:hypothetical protein